MDAKHSALPTAAPKAAPIQEATQATDSDFAHQAIYSIVRKRGAFAELLSFAATAELRR